MIERAKIQPIQNLLTQIQYRCYLSAREEFYKSFLLHKEREEFLKSYPKQTPQVRKGIGIAQFHKFATSRYDKISFDLINALIAENKALREKLEQYNILTS
jgi:hypothetical protein